MVSGSLQSRLSNFIVSHYSLHADAVNDKAQVIRKLKREKLGA